jgi:peptidyl-prolyl cis-trans isomerase C
MQITTPQTHSPSDLDVPSVSVNGHQLTLASGADAGQIREQVWAELLRQEAVREGMLTDHAPYDRAPSLSAVEQEIIAAMVERAATPPVADEQACVRYYMAHRHRFTTGQTVTLRHILFAVTPGVPVQALAQRAEAILLDLMGKKEGAAERFADAAREYSNCPSGAQGGALGTVTPADVVPELAKVLFRQEGGMPNGIQPRLVHSRFGLHIIHVLEQCPGHTPKFAEIRERVERAMSHQARVTATRQFMLQLVGAAQITGIEIEGATSPLLQ